MVKVLLRKCDRHRAELYPESEAFIILGAALANEAGHSQFDCQARFTMLTGPTHSTVKPDGIDNGASTGHGFHLNNAKSLGSSIARKRSSCDNSAISM